MTPDELLDEVGKAVREREAAGLAHPGWDKLARGEIGVEAARRDLVRDAEGEALVAAFSPLGREFTDGIVARIARQQSEAADRRMVRMSRPMGAARRGRCAMLAVVGAAATMVVAIAVLSRNSEDPLPSYQASFVGGDKSWRSAQPAAPDAVPELSTGSQLEWSLVPVRPLRGEVDARMFLVQGGIARRWAPPFDVSPDGVVRIRGTAAALGLRPGAWTLVVALGRPGAVPDDPQQALEQDKNRAESDPPVRWFTQSVLVTDGG
jgi:hypothetical protein